MKASTGPDATASGGVACGRSGCGIDEVSGGAARAVEQPSPSMLIAAAANIFRILFPVVDAQGQAGGQLLFCQLEENRPQPEASETTYDIASTGRLIEVLLD